MAMYRLFTPKEKPESSTAMQILFSATGTGGGTAMYVPNYTGTLAAMIVQAAGGGMWTFFFDAGQAAGGQQITPGWYVEQAGSSGSTTFVQVQPPTVRFADTVVDGAATATDYFKNLLLVEGTTACKLAFLEETKWYFRRKIEDAGGSIAEDATFRDYADQIG